MEGGNKMTREEEIRQAAIKYFNDYMDGLKGEVLTVEQTFEEGAKWADRTLIEKACEWLKLNTNWDDEVDEMGRNMNYGKIEEFRKAMSE